MPIEVKQGFLLLHLRGGVPVLVKGNAIISMAPIEPAQRYDHEPEMVVLALLHGNFFTVLETFGEILDAITVSYKQVIR